MVATRRPNAAAPPRTALRPRERSTLRLEDLRPDRAESLLNRGALPSRYVMGMANPSQNPLRADPGEPRSEDELRAGPYW